MTLLVERTEASERVIVVRRFSMLGHTPWWMDVVLVTAGTRIASSRSGRRRCDVRERDALGLLVTAQALGQHACNALRRFVHCGTDVELGDGEDDVRQVAQAQLHDATLVCATARAVDVGHLHARPLDVVLETADRETHPPRHVVTQAGCRFDVVTMQIDTHAGSPFEWVSTAEAGTTCDATSLTVR